MPSKIKALLVPFVLKNFEFWNYVSERPKLRLLMMLYFFYSRGSLVVSLFGAVLAAYRRWQYQKVLRQRYGVRRSVATWAIVTAGGSQVEVAKEFVQHLHNTGFNVLVLHDQDVPVDRDGDAQRFWLRTRVIGSETQVRAEAFDFKHVADDAPALEKRLQGLVAPLEVSLLVNAVDGTRVESGKTAPSDIAHFTPDGLSEGLAGTFYAVFTTTKALLAKLRQRRAGAAIVNVSAHVGDNARAARSVFTASHYGIEHFSILIRQQLQRPGSQAQGNSLHVLYVKPLSEEGQAKVQAATRPGDLVVKTLKALAALDETLSLEGFSLKLPGFGARASANRE